MKDIYLIDTRQFFILLFLLVFLFPLFIACDESDSDQEVPAFIRIDSIGLKTEYDVQGTASHNITDAWVYVDDQSIGVFELPAIVPVLAEGRHKVEIRAGIKQNGIAATRVAYPFYKPITKNDFLLTPDSISVLNEKTEYYGNTVFAWMEDFENYNNISIEKTTKSDTAITQTTENAFQGKYSGKISLGIEKPFYEGAIKNAVVLPGLYKPVFVELNYKIENILTLGLITQTMTSIIQNPILNINKTDRWKKIYINYTPAVNRNSSAIDFKVLLGSNLVSGLNEATILIDNIKLLYWEAK